VSKGRRKTGLSQSPKIGRQKFFNRIVLVTILIIVVVVTYYGFTRPVSVALPDYLNRCIPLSGSLAYSSIPQLRINVNGLTYTIPANIGIQRTCVRPIHTFSNGGAVHIDSDVNRTYTLGDFFLVWGNTFGPQFGTFNRNQVLTYRTDSTHAITMIVNNQTDTTDFENLVFPTNANSTSHPFQVIINYG
jgi:hypothetical protein